MFCKDSRKMLEEKLMSDEKKQMRQLEKTHLI